MIKAYSCRCYRVLKKESVISVTIKDIAKLANVSHTTVSRCLNDSPMISEKTKARVLKIAKDLHYEVNSSARSLSTKKTGVVGLIYQQGLEDFGSSAYINELFLELRHNLETLQLDTILVEAINPDTMLSNTSRLIRQHKVDGFLMVHDLITQEEYQLLKDHDIPAVMIHFRPRFIDLGSMDYFLTDNFKGGYLAAGHLIDKGCSSIITLSCSPNIGDEFGQRSAGCLQAMEDAGLSGDRLYTFEMSCSYINAYRFIHDHIDLVRKCDGIFAQADILASACITAMREHGIAVPQDKKVVGYDDSFYSTLVPPFITTIHQPREEITVKACSRILDLIRSDEVDRTEKEQELIEPYLIIRESS